jgi:hypothetical protein
MTDHDYQRPQDHSTTFLAARKLAPRLGLCHDNYTPPVWSIRLTDWDSSHTLYVTGTPAELHNVALAILAAFELAALDALAEWARVTGADISHVEPIHVIETDEEGTPL